MEEFVSSRDSDSHPVASATSPGDESSMERCRLDKLLSTESGLLSNVHKKEWKDAAQTGVRFKALVLPKVGVFWWW